MTQEVRNNIAHYYDYCIQEYYRNSLYEVGDLRHFFSPECWRLLRSFSLCDCGYLYSFFLDGVWSSFSR